MILEKDVLDLLPTDDLETEVRRIGLDSQYLDKVYDTLKNELSPLSVEELADKYKHTYMD